MPELGSRASQHNPGGLDCDPSSLIFGAGLFTQVLSLPLLVHYCCRTLQAMDRGRSLAQHISLKVAVFGLILGINALDLLGAALGLLPSVSHPDGLLSTSSPVEKRFTTKHIPHINPGYFAGLDPVLHQEPGQCRLNESILIPIGM